MGRVSREVGIRSSALPFWASFLHSDDHDQPGAEIAVDPQPTTTVGLTSLRLVRLNPLPPLPPPTVQEDLDLLVPGEIPRQVLAESRLIPRHNEQVWGQAWGRTVGNPGAVRSSERPPFGERPGGNGLDGAPGDGEP